MNVMQSRRIFAAGFVGALAALTGNRASAQFTEQEVLQGTDVVSTGDVNISQSASLSADGTLVINGTPITEDGVYQTNQGQVIVQNGRVVSTGDVNISQSAEGSSTELVEVWPHKDGDRAEVCSPGAVMANPNNGQVFYQGFDCCWYAACANGCKNKGCEGDYCG